MLRNALFMVVDHVEVHFRCRNSNRKGKHLLVLSKEGDHVEKTSSETHASDFLFHIKIREEPSQNCPNSYRLCMRSSSSCTRAPRTHRPSSSTKSPFCRKIVSSRNRVWWRVPRLLGKKCNASNVTIPSQSARFPRKATSFPERIENNMAATIESTERYRIELPFIKSWAADTRHLWNQVNSRSQRKVSRYSDYRHDHPPSSRSHPRRHPFPIICCSIFEVYLHQLHFCSSRKFRLHISIHNWRRILAIFLSIRVLQRFGVNSPPLSSFRHPH